MTDTENPEQKKTRFLSDKMEFLCPHNKTIHLHTLPKNIIHSLKFTHIILSDDIDHILSFYPSEEYARLEKKSSLYPAKHLRILQDIFNAIFKNQNVCNICNGRRCANADSQDPVCHLKNNRGCTFNNYKHCFYPQYSPTLVHKVHPPAVPWLFLERYTAQLHSRTHAFLQEDLERMELVYRQENFHNSTVAIKKLVLKHHGTPDDITIVIQ